MLEMPMDGTTPQAELKTGIPGGAEADSSEHDSAPYSIDIGRIMHAIPHRYPFLLIDRMEQVRRGHSAIGVKNVTVNEHFFAGHFPNHPVMPGVLIIESMAQTAAVLVVESLGGDAAGKVVYFMSIEGAKFRRPVVPGDTLKIHVTRERRRGSVWKFSGVARVDGVSVAEATYAAMIMDHKPGT
jgi:3-hydroxyacyl-[acyl-carrier-protein] dehydratase